MNNNTGRVMKRFKTKKEAEKFRKQLNKPKIHSIRTYNSEILVLDPNLVENTFTGGLSDGGTVYIAGNDNPITSGGGGIQAMSSNPNPDIPCPPNCPPLGSDPLDPDNDPDTDNSVDPNDTDGDGMPDPVGGGGSGGGSGGGGGSGVGGGLDYGGDYSSENTGNGSSNGSSQPNMQTMANDAIDATEEAFEFPEWTPLAVGGALALGAAGAAAYGINKELNDDDDDSFVDRIFSMSKEYGESAFKEYEGTIDRRSRADLETLMKIDFARNGPLYVAHEKGILGLNLERTGWVIDGIPYNAANFGKQKGFATLPKEETHYLVGNDGFVIGINDYIRRRSQGDYIEVAKSEETVKFIDDRGEQRLLQLVPRGSKIKQFGNATPEQILGGKRSASGIMPTTIVNSTDTEEVKQAKLNLARIERELNQLTSGARTTRTIAEQLDELERIEKRKKFQAEQDKKAQEARDKKQREIEIAEEVKRRQDAELQAKRNQLKGIPIPDNQVDKDRYEDDRKWVEEFVNSGFGGKITSDDYTGWRYKFNEGEGSSLEIDWTDEFAKKAGFDVGFTEKWTRSALIDLQAVPISYGIGGYPNFKQTDGSISNKYPNWIPDLNLAKYALSNENATTTTAPTVGVYGYSPSRIRRYNRTIRGDSFMGSSRSLPKNYARSIANRARILGRKARVIPAKNGFRVYVGPQRRNRR